MYRRTVKTKGRMGRNINEKRYTYKDYIEEEEMY